MDPNDPLREKWFIVFRGSKLNHWLMPYLQPHFQHCYAVKESPGKEFWMIVDGKSSCTEVRLESKRHYPHIRLLCPDCIILPIKAKINPDKNRWSLCVFNCVEQVKALLGIKAFWLWTPYQLYRYLDGR